MLCALLCAVSLCCADACESLFVLFVLGVGRQPQNSYHFSARLPDAIVYPESTAEVSRIASVCHTHRLPMLAFGSGTSLEGHTLAPAHGGGVVVDLSHMQRLVRLSVDDMDVTVEAGLSWGELNTQLKPYGLFFPVDPGPGASIGGMVATGCSGTNAVRYVSESESGVQWERREGEEGL